MSEPKWYGAKAQRHGRDAAMRGLREGAEHILTETIDDTPILSGTLRRSGTVTQGGPPISPQGVFRKARDGVWQKDAQTSPVSNDLEFWISFNTPYGRRQHQETSWNHPRGGKAKYLEDQFRKQKPRVLKRVRDLISQALKR